MSALWHGLYPGYFFFFISAAVMTNLERIVGSALRPLLCPEYDPKTDKLGGSSLHEVPPTGNTVYWAFSWVATHVAMNMTILPFSNKTWSQSVIVIRQYYGAQFWVYLAGAFVVAPLLRALFPEAYLPRRGTKTNTHRGSSSSVGSSVGDDKATFPANQNKSKSTGKSKAE